LVCKRMICKGLDHFQSQPANLSGANDPYPWWENPQDSF
jgi:hypothetical protein